MNRIQFLFSGSLENIIKTLITKDDITLFIALCGAFLSAYNAVPDYRNKTRRIKVKALYGLIPIGQSVNKVILIEAINTGYKDVTSTSTGVILLNDLHSYFLSPLNGVQLQFTLSEGKKTYGLERIGRI